jgi:hypothetical protein
MPMKTWLIVRKIVFVSLEEMALNPLRGQVAHLEANLKSLATNPKTIKKIT